MIEETYSPYDSYTTSTVDSPNGKEEPDNETKAPEETKAALELLVTRDRMRLIQIGDFLEYEDNPNSTRAQVEFLSNFVSDGQGGYLDRQDAIKEIKKLNYPQLAQTMVQLVSLIKEVAVPNQ